MMGHTLHQAAGVHKDQRRAVLFREFYDASVDFIPHLVAGNWTEQGSRNFNRQIEGALMTDVDDDRIGTAVPGEEVGNIFNGLLSSGKSNPDWRTIRESLKALKRKSEMRPSF